MNKIVKSVAVALCAVTALSFVACGDRSGADEKVDGPSVGQKQVAQAKTTFDSIYSKDGGTFAASSGVQTSATDDSTAAESAYDVISRNLVFAPFQKVWFESYVADIFAYSQVQLSIVGEYGEAALKDVYSLSYDEVDWDSDTSGYGDWIRKTKLLQAAFIGSDLENGNVYCTQIHSPTGGISARANVEYYYNSDGDLGTTTLNWRSDNTFEYHYCNGGKRDVLAAYGTYDDDGITLTRFESMRSDGIRDSMTFSSNDKKIVIDHVMSEIDRINKKIVELNELNERDETLGTDSSDGEAVLTSNSADALKQCKVSLDFRVLSKMLGKEI